jgi:serine/threonine protein kinase
VRTADLKPDNVGFTADGTLKLFDFGLCTLVQSRSTSTQVYEMTGNTGSLRYMAPEVAQQKPYCESADVYSFGIMVWQMARDRTPFDGFNRREFAEQVVKAGLRPKLDKQWPEEFTRILTFCWHSDPLQRPTFKKLIADFTKLIKSGSSP